MKVLMHGRAHRRRSSGVAPAAPLTLLVLPAFPRAAPPAAAPGDLDPTFSDDGKQLESASVFALALRKEEQ